MRNLVMQKKPTVGYRVEWYEERGISHCQVIIVDAGGLVPIKR